MSTLYHRDYRALQERLDAVRLDDRLEKVKVREHIAAQDHARSRTQELTPA